MKAANRSRRVLRRYAPVAAALVALACSSGGNPVDPDDPPRGVRLSNVVFCSGGEVDLRMDLDFPDSGGDRPVAVFFHGGAWLSGTKDEADNRWLSLLRGPLTDRGWVVAAAEYRLATTGQWPAQIHDAKCAIRFLRANAGEFGLDEAGIVAWGASAGGHLAALLGTTDPGDLEGIGGNAGFSSAVRAVVDLWGPADLTTMEGWSSFQPSILRTVFGTSDTTSAVLRQASPVHWADPGDVPFLIVHGEEDVIVPVSQSIDLEKSLRDAAVPVELIVVRNASHGLNPVGGEALSPSESQVVSRALSFFESHAP